MQAKPATPAPTPPFSTLNLYQPGTWTDYELIDSGNFEKLERFGRVITARPEPQAIWDKKLGEREWQAQAHAVFRKDKNNAEKGQWFIKDGVAANWLVQYNLPHSAAFKLKLSLSSFKHVGVFPEQTANWDYIYNQVKALQAKGIAKPRVLNLFAYTGGASLAAAAAGAQVTHVDSVKQVISWSRENMEASKLDGIRWVVEDAMKFVKREERRGSQYEAIIMDPPAYGRGADGERWLLEEHLNELLKTTAALLNPEAHFTILNLYSMGFSALIIGSLLRECFNNPANLELGELYLVDAGGRQLPLGTFGRFAK